jgi:hypothetical protein
VLTGRAKASIILNGVNYATHEIEACVEAVPGVVAAFTAAVAVRGAADVEDRLAIFFVPEVTGEAALRGLLKTIRARSIRELGVEIRYPVPVTREAIPKSSIGKIRYAALQVAFQHGDFTTERRRAEVLLETEATLSRWLYRPVWRRCEEDLFAPTAHGTTLLVLDQGGIGAELAAGLEALGEPVVRITPAPVRAQLDACHHALNQPRPATSTRFSPSCTPVASASSASWS